MPHVTCMFRDQGHICVELSDGVRYYVTDETHEAEIVRIHGIRTQNHDKVVTSTLWAHMNLHVVVPAHVEVIGQTA